LNIGAAARSWGLESESTGYIKKEGRNVLASGGRRGVVGWADCARAGGSYDVGSLGKLSCCWVSGDSENLGGFESEDASSFAEEER